MAKRMQREKWASKIGLILALAGNAIGLGNFLRFPVQAAENGGGAFMIPYFVALIVIGIPLMWAECAIGRMGGRHGHGHTAGMFEVMWRHPLSKYLGMLGVVIPFAVALYYIYITAWTLAYSYFSLTGNYFGITTREAMGAYLRGFQGVEPNQFFSSIGPAYLSFLITLGLSFYIVYRGIPGGIERLGKIAMPLLFLIGVALAVRVLTLGTPDPNYPENNVLNGLGFVWNPQPERLTDATIWLAAAGQIFFTLSVATGAIPTYASYMREEDDVALTGLSTASLNELAEVVLGGTIAITAAVAFFGLAETEEIARKGAFNLGFQALPMIFQRIPLGQLFGGLWFLLLFFAGISSVVALTQPAMALFQDGFGWSRGKTTAVVLAALFLLCQPVIFFLKHGFLDELDFWVGTFGLSLFALIETIQFAWVFGMERGWEEITKGAAITVPRIFYYVIKYITPLFLLFILAAWAIQDVPEKLLMAGVRPEDVPYVWGARVLMIAILLGFGVLVKIASSKKEKGIRP
ncbi:MAG: sodium-dependent transporter [Deltaproteobacteria bacterium]|nr:sodium-dependent transporter [Deltaproteobacteria bacterium]